MTYQEALEWIHSKLAFGIKPGLERMQWLLEQLGNPQDNISAVHIVGTNGKGSTTSYLQHIFSLAGYEVGTFTSPYITDFRERISINNQMIAKDDFIDLVESVKPTVERLPLETDMEPATEFEVITLLMLVYFGHKHPVDIAIIEAGMGGLYDSTNVLSPLAVLCPSIGLDHQDVLGDSYEQIARQKVGVLKQGVPFIYANDRSDVEQVFCKQMQETNSQGYRLGRDFKIVTDGNNFHYQMGEVGLKAIKLQLLGEHQMANASLAITASLLLFQKYPNLTLEHIKAGLEATTWAGRTELMRDNLMIDGAHNQESVEALVKVLKDYTHKPIKILVGTLTTKPVLAMLKQLETLGDVSVTQFDYPNATPLDSYPKAYPRIHSWQEWLDKACDKDCFYLVTGSLYFIAQVRAYLREE
ncbi:bifunctional folylpolyglutamate synthase/dihydrofolate synthase [Streptococcus sp. zg-JUN1979]|uniref:bifunctional folylpolyglutamate synthase/dihydrofolate synthase n=1 Tax=Streptococcus sp. zg-JUN1979 TaxID=3391450 RepID=UPI0039A5DB36